MRALVIGRCDTQSTDDVDVFWNAGAYIANAAVFLATGLSIDVPRSIHEPVLVALAVFAIAPSRIVLALLVVRDNAERTTVFLAGMRGALSLALALALPSNLPFRAIIVDGVFATVLTTLVVQGVLLEPILRHRSGRRMPARSV